ncbi:g10444 [Coccomyxa elongata]
MRHGKGVHTCTNGDCYRGYWRLDKRHGRGKATFASGMQYEGDWADDKAHGTGKARYENGGVYEGEFKHEQRCGWGRYTFPTGDQYEGEWLADKIHGQGRHTFLDGSYYEGQWAAGERVKGMWVSGNGSSEYSGQWRGDLRHGHGVLFTKGLLKYTGEWVDDMQEGHGMCQWADGTAYKGTWKGGVPDGRGTFTRPDGYVYEGEWRADAQQGHGTCRFDDGSRYEGSWEKGQRSGEGRCKYANGDIYVGDWSADARHGRGTCAYENGDKYTGDWVRDQRQGFGICRFADGTKFKGEWEGDAWLQSLAHPRHSKAKGLGLSRALAGTPATFTILAKDDLRNKRLCGGDVFAVRLNGPDSIEGRVIDNDDGTYTVNYTATVAGKYELAITDDAGEHVADSPYATRVLSGRPSVKHCAVTGDGRRSVVAGRPAHFTVEARDQFGNRHAQLTDASCDEVEPQADTKSSPKDEFQPIEDQVKKWDFIAEREYQFDGNADGWDSDVAEEETPEQKYIKAHPDVPVVENMEDLWKVSKLQRERKRRQEQIAALKEARVAKAENLDPQLIIESINIDVPSTLGRGYAEGNGNVATPAPSEERDSEHRDGHAIQPALDVPPTLASNSSKTHKSSLNNLD